MAFRELDVELDGRLNELLQEVAEKTGRDPADLRGELIRDKLRERTTPKGNRGKVQPFRRGPEQGLKRN